MIHRDTFFGIGSQLEALTLDIKALIELLSSLSEMDDHDRKDLIFEIAKHWVLKIKEDAEGITGEVYDIGKTLPMDPKICQGNKKGEVQP